MKVRISYLISVLSDVSDAPNASEARSRVLQWILDEASRSGGNKHRIRRNLIWSNHVRGKDATSTFAHLVWDAAANQNHDPLVSTVRATDDEQALRDHLTSLAAPRPLTSAEWVAMQVAEHDLDRHLTATLLRKSRMEYSELRSLVGLWLARWGADGTFDDVLAKEGNVKIGVLVRFMQGKIRNHHFRRGGEPLERMRGARTEHEVKMTREKGVSFRSRGSDEIDADAPDAVMVYDEENPIGFDFVDLESSVEDRMIRVTETEADMAFCREQVPRNHGAAAERFSRIFERLAVGQSVDEIANEEGVSVGRAAKLAYEVRAGLRASMIARETAQKILQMIKDEPFSTRQEIEEDLAIEAALVEDCLDLLLHRGTISEANGESYILTRDLKEADRQW